MCCILSFISHSGLMKWPQQLPAKRWIGPIYKNEPLSSKNFHQIQFVIILFQIEIKLQSVLELAPGWYTTEVL